MKGGRRSLLAICARRRLSTYPSVGTGPSSAWAGRACSPPFVRARYRRHGEKKPCCQLSRVVTGTGSQGANGALSPVGGTVSALHTSCYGLLTVWEGRDAALYAWRGRASLVGLKTAHRPRMPADWVGLGPRLDGGFRPDSLGPAPIITGLAILL